MLAAVGEVIYRSFVQLDLDVDDDRHFS